MSQINAILKLLKSPGSTKDEKKPMSIPIVLTRNGARVSALSQEHAEIIIEDFKRLDEEENRVNDWEDENLEPGRSYYKKSIGQEFIGYFDLETDEKIG